MKRLSILFVAAWTAVSAFSQDDCPWFSAGYPSMSYNLNTDPWEFDLQIFGDTTGANIKWYTFNSRGGQTIEDMVLYTGPGSNTVSSCFPATDISMRNTYLDYVCVVKTPKCPNGVVSPWFDVQVATGSDCMTMDGGSLTVTTNITGWAYTEGDYITLTAKFNTYGGHHHYIWYHNGKPVGEPEYKVVELAPDDYPIPTDARSIVDYKNDFNTSYLTIPACEVEDEGTWQVRVWDGISSTGDTCYRQTTVKYMSIDPVTQCPIFNWRIDGEDGLTKPLYPGETYAVSVYTTEPNPTEDKMPSPASLTIESASVTILDTVAVGDTLTVRFTISEEVETGTAITVTAKSDTVGIHYRKCSETHQLQIIVPDKKCPDWKWAVNGEEGVVPPMYQGEEYDISITTEEEAPIAALLIEGEGVTMGKPDTVGHTVTAHIIIDKYAPVGGEIRILASTDKQGLDYEACADSIKPLIKAYGYLVFDNNNETGVWSDSKNWWPNYDRVPAATDSAVIRSACQVDINNAVVKDLTFEVVDATDLTLLPTGALTIVGNLTNVAEGDILIQSNASGNGALVLSEVNENIPATVQFYSRSKEMSTTAPVWQYMGYPMQASAATNAVYPGAAMYEWTNTPNLQLGGNWACVDSLSKTVVPFKGYCMTEESETTYTFSGLLNNPVTTEVVIPNNDQGEYPHFAFVANSWVAPISIARMEESQFGDADATVYIMNTGTYFEAKDQQSAISKDGTAMARGQYNAIPVHAASYLDGSLQVIPSMQGFFVHATQATTLTLDYQKAVFGSTDYIVSTEATRVSARRAAGFAPVVCRLNVSGFGAEVNTYLLESNAFTNRFENGWDAYQFQSDRSNIHISVKTEDGNLSVAAVPQMEGQVIDFSGAKDKYYTLTVYCDDSKMTQGLYLWDTESDTYTPMLNGSTYLFTSTPSANRFHIVNKEQVMGTEVNTEKFIHQGRMYIRKNGTIYTSTGFQL